MSKALFLTLIAALMVWAVLYSIRRDSQAFDAHMRIQDSLDAVAACRHDLTLDSCPITWMRPGKPDSVFYWVQYDIIIGGARMNVSRPRWPCP